MQNHQVNVMHLIVDLNRNGAQEVVRTLIEYLAVENCQPVVCALRDGPLRQEIEALGVPVEIVADRRYGLASGLGFFTEVLRIRRELTYVIKKYNINVIQTHLVGIVDFVTLTLRIGTDLKAVLWTMHNVNFLPGKKRPQKGIIGKFRTPGHILLYRLTSLGVNRFVAISEEVATSMQEQLGSLQDKIVTISNGVDVKRYEGEGDKAALCQELGLAEDSYLAIVVGRLNEQKGHCYLIDAMPDILAQHPNFHVLCAGEGHLREDLEAQIEKLGVSDNFHLLGMRANIPQMLASVDMFAMPSLWEGLAMALLEAMASSKPIVATAVSGTTQVMIPGETGLIVPSKDSKALSDAIIDMISHPDKAQEMGRKAKKQVVENYSAQKQASEYLTVYRQLLAESH